MYKVFVNDKPIILTDSPKKSLGFHVYNYENVVLEEILHKLKKNNVKGILIFCKNLSKSWTHFLSHFQVVKAAGGLVLNKQNDFLFIYRKNKWDLPKGRIEKNESIDVTALREVEEECGIQELQLDRFLLTTFHLFSQDNQHTLKETHWFLMNTNYKGKLTPQLEEGITLAEFKNKEATLEALKNSYANIQLVFDKYYS